MSVSLLSIGSTSTNSMPPGSIAAWPTTTPPSGWLACNGSSYSTSTYPNLYAAIGAAFGSASGTFNVPNLQSLVPAGVNGATFGSVGQSGGQASVTLSASQIPTHQHGVSDPSHSHGIQEQAHTHTHYYGSNQFFNQNQQADTCVYQYGGNQQFNQNQGQNTLQSYAQGSGVGLSIQGNQAGLQGLYSTGGGQGHNNLQPYYVLLYIIKT